MRRTLVALSVLAMVFAFAGTAAAADLCLDCGPKACYVDPVPCCDWSVQTGGTATYFDWEHHWGYCEPFKSTSCRLIFDLCECGDDPNATFASGNTIGVRMTILTTGVYWTSTPISVQVATDTDVLCGIWPGICNGPCPGGCPPVLGTNTYGQYNLGNPPHVYADAAGDNVPAGNVTNPYCCYGSIPAWESYMKTCEVDCNAKAKVVQTCGTDGVLITPAFWANPLTPYKYWAVNIPAMLVNKSEVEKGALVKVKVELLSTGTGGICVSCSPACECEVTVASLCCEEAEQNCIFFPYVTTDTSLGWKTGIALTNVSGETSLDMTLTLTDNGGNEFVWFIPGWTPRVQAFFMDAVISNFVGTGTPGPIGMLKVESNEGWIDGYSFMTDGVFGGSTLARACCPIACMMSNNFN